MSAERNTLHLFFCGAIFALVLSSCTWVKPSEQASTVKVLDAAQVEACSLLGETTSSVKDAVGFIHRSRKKVAKELLTLAKNEASTMGGNAVVVDSELSEGRQRFKVYNCE